MFLDLITLKGTNGGLSGEETPPIGAFNLSEPSLCDLRNKAYNTRRLTDCGSTIRRQGPDSVVDLVMGLSLLG